MTGELCLRNRQHTRPVDLRLLRRITRTLLADYFDASRVELCIHLVAVTEMARLNETFLDHQGSTDVISFDYLDSTSRNARAEPQRRTRNAERTMILHGEIFICLDEAVAQARQFRTTWQSELVRYLIHGLLHLQGFDDLDSSSRHRMKREEERLLQELAKQFLLPKLARPNRESKIENRKSR